MRDHVEPAEVTEASGHTIAVWERSYGLYGQFYDPDGLCGVALAGDKDLLRRCFDEQLNKGFPDRGKVSGLFPFDPVNPEKADESAGEG